MECIFIKSISAYFKVQQIGDLSQATQASNLILAFKHYYEPIFNRAENIHCLIGSIDIQITASWWQVVNRNSDSQVK